MRHAHMPILSLFRVVCICLCLGMPTCTNFQGTHPWRRLLFPFSDIIYLSSSAAFHLGVAVLLDFPHPYYHVGIHMALLHLCYNIVTGIALFQGLFEATILLRSHGCNFLLYFEGRADILTLWLL